MTDDMGKLITVRLEHEILGHDPAMQTTKLTLETDHGIWLERVARKDVDMALRFLRAGADMAGGRVRVEGES